MTAAFLIAGGFAVVGVPLGLWALLVTAMNERGLHHDR